MTTEAAADALLVTFGKVASSVAAGILVSVPLAFQLVVVLSLTELAATLYSPKAKFAKEAAKVSLTLILCISAHILQSISSAMYKVHMGENLGINFATLICFYYSFGTVISICRHCCDADLRLPPRALDLLRRFEGASESDKKELEDIASKQGDGR